MPNVYPVQELTDLLATITKDQAVGRVRAGCVRVDSGFVFTTELGGPMAPRLPSDLGWCDGANWGQK